MIHKFLIRYLIFIIVLLCSKINVLYASDENIKQQLSVIFYNLENLFDLVDDPGIADDEFTESGARKWTEKKYHAKLNKISQAILASNKWEMPDVIAIAEIENKGVLNDLLIKSLLSSGSYNILHKESPDHRGIDVALLYRYECIQIKDSGFYEVQTSVNSYSRDILYAKLLFNEETFHAFVCHWPSRYGGQKASEVNRLHASNILKENVQDICLKDSLAKIIIMGDFNDEPQDESLQNLLDLPLTNLMDKEFERGSIKFKNKWYMFDQFILSNQFLNARKFKVEVEIVELPFLMQKDKKYLGLKPFRTYNGFKFQGGYSDHLPIRLLIKFEND